MVDETAHHDLAMDLRQDRGVELDPRAYWKIVSDRRWIVLGILGAVMVLAVVLTLLTTPMYRALSTIQIQRDTIKVINSEGVAPADSAFDREYYQT
ncbi:MAG: hypothetical protein H0T88_09885, partial [Lysobacter sp.]|nr:hypothetical protein [Lysobacter sp.]